MLIDLSFLGMDPVFLNFSGMAARLNPDMLNVQLMTYVGMFIGILTAFEGLRQVLSRGEQRNEARSRRMQMIDSGKTTEEILAILKPAGRSGLLGNLPIIGDLPTKLNQAGISFSPAFVVMACASGILLFGAGASTVLGPLVGIPAAFAMFGVLPMLLIISARNKRMATLVRQLPDALELMSRGLKVGHPLNTTIRSVATDMQDPIATEFGVVMDQIAYGDDLTDAFAEMADRIDLEDVRYLSVSIGIQHGSGGDLARVLNTLSRVIRNRLSMRRRIRAISSEGRMSAYLLSAIPVVIFAFTSMTAPEYYGSVADDPMFKPLAIVVVALVISNAIVLQKLVNFRL